MQIINNTATSHLSVLKDLLSISDDVLIASPFCYSDFKEFADVVASSGVKRVRFVTTLKEDEVVGKIDALHSFCHEMKRIDVEWKLMIDNKLHGKVYVFRKDGNAKAAIISSANLTRNGGMNLNGLNFGCDKIRLSEDYRRYLLGVITKTTQFSTIENE